MPASNLQERQVKALESIATSLSSLVATIEGEELYVRADVVTHK